MFVTILIAIACLVLGFVIGRVLTSRSYLAEQDRLRQELRDLEASLETYQQEVAGHFVQSADLFNQLTHSYKAVVDHMAQGASHLVAEEVLQKRLGDSQQEAVVLTPIGQIKRLAATQTGVGASEHSATDRGETAPDEAQQQTSSSAKEEASVEGQADDQSAANQQTAQPESTTTPDLHTDMQQSDDEPIKSADVSQAEDDQESVAKAA